MLSENAHVTGSNIDLSLKDACTCHMLRPSKRYDQYSECV
jgi:hypothetical protein